MAKTEIRTRRKSIANLLQAMISLGISLAVMLAAMFLPAGTWDWRRGWMFLAVFYVFTAIACVWIWIRNPELFAARSRIQRGTKAWDVPRHPRHHIVVRRHPSVFSA